MTSLTKKKEKRKGVGGRRNCKPKEDNKMHVKQ